ncbi:hypothetical protein OROHE_004033 [Orobanche hederae]
MDLIKEMKAERENLEEVIRRYRSGGELIINGVKIEKRKKLRKKVAAPTRRQGGFAPAPPSFTKFDLSPGGMPIWNPTGLPIHFLFEFATGYALFDANGVNEILDFNFESAEKYIHRSAQIFTLKAFHRFLSTDDALVQMYAISNSIVTEQLQSFLLKNLPKPIDGKPCYFVAVFDPLMAHDMVVKTRMTLQTNIVFNNVMRGLRMNIEKLIGGSHPRDLQKAQLNLTRLYSRQRCTTTGNRESCVAVSPSPLREVVVVPHICEGVFIAKGKDKEDLICTRNLVPGKALHGDELISVWNEDETEIEYRVWSPLRSKLAAAIVCGVSNIWAKPGSRVLYLGDVCGNTVSHLSDLVGSDGLVYVVGLSDIVNTAEYRSNVVPIFKKGYYYWKYRMVVGMVDVIIANMVHPHEVSDTADIALNAGAYLRSGGHYMIFTRANNIDSTSQIKNPLADLDDDIQREFMPIEQVVLEPMGREHAVAIGGFRMLEE